METTRIVFTVTVFGGVAASGSPAVTGARKVARSAIHLVEWQVYEVRCEESDSTLERSIHSGPAWTVRHHRGCVCGGYTLPVVAGDAPNFSTYEKSAFLALPFLSDF